MNELDSFDNIHTSSRINDKFNESIDRMRLLTWQKYLLGLANNPQLNKKEVCDQLGLRVGTINSIQKHYKLQSPFYFKKAKKHSKKQKDVVTGLVDKKSTNKDKTKKIKGGAEDVTDEYIDQLIN